MESLGIGLTAALAAGLLSFLSPCVLPLVPSYLSFVTGLSLEDLESGDAELRRTALVHSVLFVVGFSSIFMALGASATFLGQLLREYQIWIALVGGVIVVLFGLHLLGITPFRWLQRERRVHLEHRPVGYVGSYLVGVTFGAGWTPCIGPILGGILTFAATRQTLSEGVLLLAVYSIGLAIPFLLSTIGLTWFLSTFKRLRRHMVWVERVSGGLLVVVGFLLLSGQFTLLASWAASLTPDFILERI
jgi:cytochrome c-type biogenesis protein